MIKSTSTNGTFGTFAVTAVMNGDTFNALSEEHQKALMQAGDETVLHLGAYQDAEVSKALREFKDLGIAVYQFDDAMLAELKPILASVKRAWIDRMSARNLDGAGIVSAFEDAVAEAESQ